MVCSYEVHKRAWVAVKDQCKFLLSMYRKVFELFLAGDMQVYEEIQSGYMKTREMTDTVLTQCLLPISTDSPSDDDIRFLAALGIVSVFNERVGRVLQQMTKDALALYGDRSVGTITNMTRMTDHVKTMLSMIVDTMDTGDVKPLYGLTDILYEVQSCRSELTREAVDFIRMAPEFLDNRIHYMALSRYVEHAADDLCRVAENLIYALTDEKVILI